MNLPIVLHVLPAEAQGGVYRRLAPHDHIAGACDGLVPGSSVTKIQWGKGVTYRCSEKPSTRPCATLSGTCVKCYIKTQREDAWGAYREVQLVAAPHDAEAAIALPAIEKIRGKPWETKVRRKGPRACGRTAVPTQPAAKSRGHR